MNIFIPVIGSRGDVQPFIALAQGLSAVGHAVTIASHPGMRNLVESHQVAFAPMGPDIDMSQEAGAIRDRTASPILGLFRVMQLAFQIIEQSHGDLLEILRRADLAVIHAQSAVGKIEADLHGLPNLSVTFMPWAIPWQDPGRPLHKRWAYGAFDRLVGIMTTRPFNRLRREHGLDPVGDEGFMSKILNLIPISPCVYPHNRYWEPHHRLVGYWFAEDPAGWEPPAKILKFLQEGDPPLVVSLGAMSIGEKAPREAAEIFLAAIRRTGIRAILQGWDQALTNRALPPSICRAGFLPHSWLLPQCAGIVHHGGFGTTAAGFRAGIPQLAIPHLADQFYWGKRIEELGVGLPAILRGRLTEAGLASSLQRMIEAAQLRVNAADLKQRVGAEAGIQAAVELMEAQFGG